MTPKTIPFVVGIAVAASGGVPATTAQLPAANLAIHTTVSRRTVRPGGTITFTIRVTNEGEAPATEITICDRLPRSVARIVHLGGLHLFDRNACHTERSLAARTTTRVHLTVTVARRAHGGVEHNVAEVLWSDRRARAGASYRVTPAPPRCA